MGLERGVDNFESRLSFSFGRIDDEDSHIEVDPSLLWGLRIAYLGVAIKTHFKKIAWSGVVAGGIVGSYFTYQHYSDTNRSIVEAQSYTNSKSLDLRVN